MYGISAKLPLFVDKIDGAYALNKTLLETVKQNLTTLVMTNPGERVMDTSFGVGLRRALFENFTPSLQDTIKTRITNQTKKYMPFLTITAVEVKQDEVNENALRVKIKYFVRSLSSADELSLNF